MMIRLPRGDIRLVRFIIEDPDHKKTRIDFSEVYLTVKKTENDRAFLFQKKLSTGEITKLEHGDYQVRIESIDTDNLAYGNYKFDIQLVYENEVKETFIGDFIITPEVTFAENE